MFHKMLLAVAVLTISFTINAMENSAHKTDEQLLREGFHFEAIGKMDLAITRYEQSGLLGNIKAQFTLAVIYEQKSKNAANSPQKEDFLNRAQAWCLKAAQQGHSQAQFKLAGIFNEKCESASEHRDKEAFLNESLNWCLKAAEQGFVSALYNLGPIYEQKSSLATDPEQKKDCLSQAIEWYLKAAQRGHDLAQYGLGSIFHRQSNISCHQPGPGRSPLIKPSRPLQCSTCAWKACERRPPMAALPGG